MRVQFRCVAAQLVGTTASPSDELAVRIGREPRLYWLEIQRRDLLCWYKEWNAISELLGVKMTDQCAYVYIGKTYTILL